MYKPLQIYKPHKPVMQKPSVKLPLQIEAFPGTYTWKIALKYKVKQDKKGKFTSKYNASPLYFETQISLRR